MLAPVQTAERLRALPGLGVRGRMRRTGQCARYSRPALETIYAVASEIIAVDLPVFALTGTRHWGRIQLTGRGRRSGRSFSGTPEPDGASPPGYGWAAGLHPVEGDPLPRLPWT
jgi:hypothetical protein